MSFFKWLDSRIENFNWYDISLIKLSVLAFTLLVVKSWPVLASFEWYWYVIIMIAAAIPPWLKMFCSCKKK